RAERADGRFGPGRARAGLRGGRGPRRRVRGARARGRREVREVLERAARHGLRVRRVLPSLTPPGARPGPRGRPCDCAVVRERTIATDYTTHHPAADSNEPLRDPRYCRMPLTAGARSRDMFGATGDRARNELLPAIYG